LSCIQQYYWKVSIGLFFHLEKRYIEVPGIMPKKIDLLSFLGFGQNCKIMAKSKLSLD
tara:strand:+ start:92 stop:265 length:174 start_codon:yes stop_codon:yes gene_type:complete